MPFGAPVIQKAGKHLVAVGTVILQDEHGKRTQVDHGNPLPDGVDAKIMKHLERTGAAAKAVMPTPAPGVEAKQAEWTFDQARGVWLDESGNVHAPGPQPAEKEDDDE